ncbi:uncharacterized protein JCM10292_007515 [Rhodotorula paludigena]|uniref:uncharacterized protein n=1 Tax=Rhodotorula paludigena TaxID=86838 RepID=UPI00316B77EA
MQGSTEASTSAAPVGPAPVPLAPQLQQRLAGTKGFRAAGSKKRKLACEPCRERRVSCPGEPKPKKRLKRGEASPPAPTEIDKRLALYPLGHGGSVHLIDNHIDTALPIIPGLPLRYYRKILYATTEFNSREMEIGAEVICGAFLACAVTYSDDSLFTGSNDFFRPKIAPEGCPYNWETYLPVGTNRRDAAETFSLHARQIFEDSGMRLRPSFEAVYAILAMDQKAVWTAERGRSDREFVQLACETWRTVLRERKEAPKEDHLQPTMGPLAVHLLLLDAETAATLGLGCILCAPSSLCELMMS